MSNIFFEIIFWLNPRNAANLPVPLLHFWRPLFLLPFSALLISLRKYLLGLLRPTSCTFMIYSSPLPTGAISTWFQPICSSLSVCAPASCQLGYSREGFERDHNFTVMAAIYVDDERIDTATLKPDHCWADIVFYFYIVKTSVLRNTAEKMTSTYRSVSVHLYLPDLYVGVLSNLSCGSYATSKTKAACMFVCIESGTHA